MQCVCRSRGRHCRCWPARSNGTTEREVKECGRRFLSLSADLGTVSSIPAILERTVSEYGHIDILVNNAGIIRREDALNFAEKDWQGSRLADGAIPATFRASLYFLPHPRAIIFMAPQFLSTADGLRDKMSDLATLPKRNSRRKWMHRDKRGRYTNPARRSR